MDKLSISVQVDLALLKDLLKFPEEVEIIGVDGAEMQGHTINLLIATPPGHLKLRPLSAIFHQYQGQSNFSHFE